MQQSEQEAKRLGDEMLHNVLWAQVMGSQTEYPYGKVIFVNQPK